MSKFQRHDGKVSVVRSQRPNIAAKLLAAAKAITPPSVRSPMELRDLFFTRKWTGNCKTEINKTLAQYPESPFPSHIGAMFHSINERDYGAAISHGISALKTLDLVMEPLFITVSSAHKVHNR
jgi:hypothetical protein